MTKIAKGLLSFGVLFILAGIFFRYKDDVFVYVDQYLSPYKYVTLGEKNEYYRDKDFQFVQNTDSFIPMSEQDIINIYYTVINAGKDNFTFYCTEDYPDCLDAIQKLANDQTKLSDINNYVHPFNSFSHIETEYDTLGKVTINIVRNYKSDQISAINQKVEELSTQLLDYSDSSYNNIKRVHDYIINHTKYDSSRSENGDSTYHSDIAYGPLFEGKAVCGGYTDLMQLFLEKLKIENYRVSSEKHVWNALKYNGKWVNLDLTWDDPLVSDGRDYLEYDYFLITTKHLQDIEKTQHYFDINHYPELKEA